MDACRPAVAAAAEYVTGFVDGGTMGDHNNQSFPGLSWAP